MAKVHIMCGKIASGKTTYAKKIRENHRTVILSVDDLMQKLYDTCPGEKQHTDTVKRIMNYFYEFAENMILKDIDVILDYGYWTRADRTRVKEYFEGKRIKTTLYYIQVPEKTRLSQLEHRNKALESSQIIDEDIRKKLDSYFEEPDKDEIDVLVKPE